MLKNLLDSLPLGLLLFVSVQYFRLWRKTNGERDKNSVYKPSAGAFYEEILKKRYPNIDFDVRRFGGLPNGTPLPKDIRNGKVYLDPIEYHYAVIRWLDLAYVPFRFTPPIIEPEAMYRRNFSRPSKGYEYDDVVIVLGATMNYLNNNYMNFADDFTKVYETKKTEYLKNPERFLVEEEL